MSKKEKFTNCFGEEMERQVEETYHAQQENQYRLEIERELQERNDYEV